MVHDRIRARAPPTDADRWRRGTVRAVREADGGRAVTVVPDDGTGADDPVEVTVTDAVYELFVGRLDGDDDPVGATVWFK